MEGNQQDAKAFLESKGFNVDSDDIKVYAYDEGYIITKSVENYLGEKVPMIIRLSNNRWPGDGNKRVNVLNKDDLYITSVENGTVEQQRDWQDKGLMEVVKDTFNKFLYHVLGKGEFYFQNANEADLMNEFSEKENLGEGIKIFIAKGGRRRRKTRVVKRNKKKHTTRKIKKRKKSTKKRRTKKRKGTIKV